MMETSARQALPLIKTSDVPAAVDRAMRRPVLRIFLVVLAALAAAPAPAACDDPAWGTATVMARLATAVPVAEGVDFTDCPDLNKIVAFAIGPGPFTLQLSDATAPSVTMALTQAP